MTFSRADEQHCVAVDLKPVLDLALDIAFNELRYRFWHCSLPASSSM